MKESSNLLNSIYKNTDMGITSIHELLVNGTRNQDFRDQITHQANEYSEIKYQAENLMKQKGITPQGVNSIAKKMADMSVKANVNSDISVAHCAQMMIKGSTMGINKIAKGMRENDNITEPERNLAEKLLATEQDNIKKLIRFL